MNNNIRLHPAIQTIAAFVVTFVIGFWFLALPQAKRMGELFTQNEIENVNNTKNTNGTNSNGLKTQDVELAQRLLPTDDEQYDLAVQIEALTKSVGVTLTTMSINGADANLGPKTSTATSTSTSTKVGNGQVNKVIATLAVAGTYADIQRFIIGLHQLDRMIQLDQLTMNAGVSGGSGSVSGSGSVGVGSMGNSTSTVLGTDQVTAQITALAYYMPIVTTATTTANTSTNSTTTNSTTNEKE